MQHFLKSVYKHRSGIQWKIIKYFREPVECTSVNWRLIAKLQAWIQTTWESRNEKSMYQNISVAPTSLSFAEKAILQQHPSMVFLNQRVLCTLQPSEAVISAPKNGATWRWNVKCLVFLLKVIQKSLRHCHTNIRVS